MSLPRITLITVVRNGAAFIERCLQSMAAQNYPNLEYIIMDGASTDGTQDIIERYRPLISIYHSRPDKGAYDAAQQAFALATGDLIGYVMADDWLSPDALHTIAALYSAKPHADMVCFGMQEYKEDQAGNLIATRHFCDPSSEIFSLVDGIYCQGVNRFYSGRMIKEEGYFRENLYKNLADRDFYLRIAMRSPKKAWTDKVLYNFLTHAGSNSTGGSAQKVVTFLDETVRIAQDYLKHPGISAQDKKHLANWYCFNSLRAVWFRVKAKRYGEAFKRAACLLMCKPIATLRNIVNWKMPEAYRAKYR